MKKDISGNEKSVKMRNMPMGKLIFQMSIPAIFSMFIQSLYNIVDTKYISMIDVTNDDGIKALGYAFIIQMIMLAFSLGIGVGGTILISRKLGQEKVDEASNVGRTAILLAVVFGLLFLGLSFFLPKFFMNSVSGITSIQEYGNKYLTICMFFVIFQVVELVISKLLQGMGRMTIPMIAQLVGAITNIILDPILIFNFDLGVVGAAYATVIGQFMAFMVDMIYIFSTKLDISLNFKDYKFSINHVKEIFIAGLPVIIMNSLSSFVNLILYKVLRDLDPTEDAVGVLSVYYKLQSFVFMPVFGLTQGGLPILSYNFGARIKERYKKGLIILFISSFSIMIVGFLIFQIFPGILLDFLSITDNAKQMGIVALKTISYCFIPASIGIIMVNAFQSVGHNCKALFMNLLRQAGLLIPLAILLSKFIDVNGVWLAFPIAEATCLIVFIPILILTLKKTVFVINDNIDLDY